MNAILDACAVIAYLRKEPGGDVVAAALLAPDTTCYIHAVNLCEVYYDFLRVADVATARQVIADLKADGILIRRDLSEGFWQAIGALKARGRISIADCFCLVLAQRLGGEVLTSDHHEFDRLVPLGICPVRFIR